MKPAEYTAELSGELKQLDAKLAELRQSKAKALAELTQGGPRSTHAFENTTLAPAPGCHPRFFHLGCHAPSTPSSVSAMRHSQCENPMLDAMPSGVVPGNGPGPRNAEIDRNPRPILLISY